MPRVIEPETTDHLEITATPNEPRGTIYGLHNRFYDESEGFADSLAELPADCVKEQALHAKTTWRRLRAISMLVENDLVCDNSTDAGLRAEDLEPLVVEVCNEVWRLQDNLANLGAMMAAGKFEEPEPELDLPDEVTAEEWRALGERLAKLPGARLAELYARGLAEVEANDKQIWAQMEVLRGFKEKQGYVDQFMVESISNRLRELGADPSEVIPDDLIKQPDPRAPRR